MKYNIDDQDTLNYRYDKNGNLVFDAAEEIDTIRWTVSGKIEAVIRTSASTKPSLYFYYDALGNRSIKQVVPASGTQTFEFYKRDATGNILATYKVADSSGTKILKLEQREIYGSIRLGVITQEVRIAENGSWPSVLPTYDTANAPFMLWNADSTYQDSVFINPFDSVGYNIKVNKYLGYRNYELSNHLGNVLAVISDRKYGEDSDIDGELELFKPKVLSETDYYAGGMLMPGRNFTSNSYRYGAFGYEKDDEVNGNGNNYTTEARPYDPRLIRWWTPDPQFKLQPGWSPYKAFLCNPILFTDPEGETEYITIIINDKRTGKSTTITKVESYEVFTDNVVQMVDDGLGGYYNQKNWYDKQTTYNVTIDKDGKVTSESSTRLLKENGVKETTSGPLMNSSTWANFNVPELEGEGGVQEGGFYFTSAEGGASPTKFKSLSDAEARDVGDLLDVLGALGSGKQSLIGEASLGNKVPDMIYDLVGMAKETMELKETFSKKGQGTQVECPTCDRTDSLHIDDLHGKGTYQYLKGEEKK